MAKIPDRWIPYKACGNVIEGTRLICFKVPLRRMTRSILKYVPDPWQQGEIHVPLGIVLMGISDDLLQSVQTGNQSITEIWDIPALLAKLPKLAGVIDLTNTARYYDPRELKAAGIYYKKILVPGRVIPPEDKVKEFMSTVDEFLERNDESLLGVHCTHGLNRTGYMVVRYMRDRLGIPAKDAIKKFEKARGYQIERENYIADLLGKQVPPPDLESHTKVKPVDRKNSMTYKSPLENDDEDSYTSRDNNRRYGFRSRYSRNDKYISPGSRNDEPSRRESKSRKRKNSEREHCSSNKSYDFRYDY